jgi:hypothetical protein
MIKRACLALALTSVLGVASAATVGETHRSTTTPTAALRDAAHSDALAITVWYPAVDGAKEEPLDMGSPGHPLSWPERPPRMQRSRRANIRWCCCRMVSVARRA